MTRVTFVQSSARDDSSISSNPARLVNLYPEPVSTGGRSSALLRPCYGMSQIADLDGIFIRSMYEFDGYIYAIMPGAIYRTDAAGTVKLGNAASGETGAISRNLAAITGCIGGAYYVWDTATDTLSSPPTGPVSSVAWVEYLAGRTIIGEVGTSKFAWSDIADPSTFDGLNFAEAEAREDASTRGLVLGNNLYIFGEKTTEIWGASGSGVNAFAPLGIVLDRGLKSFGLICTVDNAFFMVGNDDIAYVMVGNGYQAISTPAVNTALRDSDPRACIFWEERGHKFAAITFSDRPAWVYDFTTQVWWERSEGPGRRPWRARASAKLGDWVIGGDDGTLYSMREIETDAELLLYREATSFPLDRDFQWFTVAELEIQTGAGFVTGEIALEIGDGVSFGLSQGEALAPVGNFAQRCIFRALGRHRIFVARVSMTGPLVPIYGDCRVRLA